jgi:glycosyltransferase involved in cell wall biosynthesis
VSAVTVVIPTYGRPELLAEAVNSVLCQTWPDLECIIVDDSSPTPVAEVNDARVRLIRRKVNGGAAAAINTGVAACQGEFIAILGDDDLYPTDRIERMIKAIGTGPLLISWARYLDDPAPSPGRQLDGDVADSILDTFVPSMGSILIRRDAWQDVDETYRTCEDVEWWIRITRTCHVRTLPEFGYLVRRHPGERHLSGDEARLRDSLRLLEHHAEYFSTHRRARAFRWRRVATYAGRLGLRQEATVAIARSLMARPSLGLIRHAVPTLLGHR